MRRLTTTAAAAGILLGSSQLVATPAVASGPGDTPVIALLDSGIRATHQEFDYRGPASTDDQLVGWWDFTADKKPALTPPLPGQSWDPAVPEPYDTAGHGTVSASMAAGLNRSSVKSPSAAPGAKLAMARVANDAGLIVGDIAAAVRWATDTVHADVINISIQSVVPAPAAIVSKDYRAITYARSKGVLVTVANGNGFLNLGAVTGDPGWAHYYSSSPDVLAVGGWGVEGALVSTDPELGAEYNVTAAGSTSDSAYAAASGTSFGAPYVAGFAASLIATARAAGRSLPVDRLETLLKHSALDDATVPPSFEGYGRLSQAELPAAQAHAAAGTLPARPSPDLNAIYVEQYAGALRSAWSSLLLPASLVG